MGPGRLLCWTEVMVGEVSGVSASAMDNSHLPRPHPRMSVEEMLAAKETKPIRVIEGLAADTFASDEEVEEFVAFAYAERHRDLS
jgi:hypothetical protein